MTTTPSIVSGEFTPLKEVKMTLHELTDLQRYANRHIAFALTLACPLKCSHCIAESSPTRRTETMPMSDAIAYAAQFRELREQGVQCISFTGGEAVLAPKQLRFMSEAAARNDMVCGIVSSAYWATSERAARTIYDSFPEIVAWDLSTDIFHEEFVPMQRIRTAYEVGKAMGREITLRVTHATPLSTEDRDILKRMASFAPRADVMFQPLRHLGRGRDLCEGPERPPVWARPCITQGMLIAHDGYVAPCCCSLAEDRRQPFDFGNARTRPLVEVLDDFACNPLLQLLRTIGFFEPLRWALEEGLEDELPRPLPDDICDLCAAMLLQPRIADTLKKRAARPENLLRIAAMTSRMLGENRLLFRTVDGLSRNAPSTPGLDDAIALAAQSRNTGCEPSTVVPMEQRA